MLGAQAPSVHHPRALVGCMLRSAQLARSHAPARCALVAAVLPVIQARRSCLCMPLRRAEAAAANFTSILIVPHALGLLATADEGKLASAAVLERGAHRQKSLCSSPGTPHAANESSRLYIVALRVPFTPYGQHSPWALHLCTLRQTVIHHKSTPAAVCN